MTKTRVDTDSRVNGRSMSRCLGRIASTATIALASLALAHGDPASTMMAVLVVGVWLWLAISAIVGIARFVIAGTSEAASKTQQNPWNLMPGVPRICAWTGVLLVGVATAALFSASQGALATSMELFLLWRLALAMGGDRPCEPDRDAPAATVDYTPLTTGPGIFGICVTAGALWLALSTPPAWAEGMILTYFWIVVLGTTFASNVAAFVFTVGRSSWMQKHHEESWRRSPARSGRLPPLFPPTTPEPPRSTGQQLTMWLWRASWIVIAWALWATGQPLLAGLYLLASLLKLTMRVHARRFKHGDTAQIDFLARAIHFILWWPLVVVAAAAVATIVIPFIVFGAFWDRVFGTTTTAPDPQTNWEREARLRRARIRRAAASYRLREAFGKPDGFVYFMGSEPHQHQHFTGPGGLLAGLGDRVVARDYRRHVLKVRNTLNWMAFEQAPEGALLHVNGISNMRRDLPFIAVVPPRGLVQVFGLSEPYRARRRDGGAALERAEAEVGAAIAAALTPDADGSSPDSSRASP